ncbi:MAG TPA: hypothetical protein VMT95_09045 [Candidatus Binatia bacterium]|nr:hypothetical protein [Candidatus Binatia bacterium]
MIKHAPLLVGLLALAACSETTHFQPYAPQAAARLCCADSLAAMNGSDRVIVPPLAARMDPLFAPKQVLYVSTGGDIAAFAWPNPGQLLGVIPGSNPQGECPSGNGDWWVVATGNLGQVSHVREYGHWGGKQLAVLSEGKAANAVSCAIDPINGDLAVGNFTTNGSSGPGSIGVFHHAHGRATIYQAPKFLHVYFVGYDPKGKLYLDGIDDSKAFALASFNGKTFTPIVVSGATINFPGAVQYADGSLTLADQLGASGYSVVYRISSGGKVTGSTQLQQSTDCVETFIYGKRVICPNAYNGGGGSVLIYPYPAGGNPLETITGFPSTPSSAVVSN